jgi:hypothetical protein
MDARSHLTVLKEEQVRAIHEDRRPYYRIAMDYGVSAMTVSHIKSNRTWRHLGLKPTTRGRNYKPFPRTKEDEHNANS